MVTLSIVVALGRMTLNDTAPARPRRHDGASPKRDHCAFTTPTADRLLKAKQKLEHILSVCTKSIKLQRELPTTRAAAEMKSILVLKER